MIKFNTGLGEILSKVFLSNNMHTVEPLLRDTVMIMQIVTLKEGEIQNWQKRNKIWSYISANRGLSETGPRSSFISLKKPPLRCKNFLIWVCPLEQLGKESVAGRIFCLSEEHPWPMFCGVVHFQLNYLAFVFPWHSLCGSSGHHGVWRTTSLMFAHHIWEPRL